MTPNNKSAIIGFWRSGAPIEQICWGMNMKYWEVEEIINNYVATH